MLSPFEQEYFNLVLDVAINGHQRPSRSGDTISAFGKTLTFDLEENKFPVLQGRKMYVWGVLGEMAAFLQGPKHLSDFQRQGCNYWTPCADPDGAIRVDYGNAWIDFNGVNQLVNLVHGLKTDPYGRRHLISAWRPDRLAELSLPCCHLMYQWYVTKNNTLDMHWYQRSTDVMVGLPSDAILAAVFNILVAGEVGLKPGTITMFLGDTHIYSNHATQTAIYADNVRFLRDKHIEWPRYDIAQMSSLFTFNPADLVVYYSDYEQPISFPVNV
jgi:thymidylate synthase